MRSPSLRSWLWLMRKEWRELLVARAWWVMLACIGPLVGVAFISAVRTYAEASGLGGTTAGVGEAFSPLDGIWMPTFTAYELAGTFLLPFVAIRVIAGDRQSGALKLELQQAVAPILRIGAKGLVLFAGWSIACVPAIVAVVLWMSYGGHAYGPELASCALGHVLNAGLTIAVAAAAASIAENPSTAAILTLAFTVGTWILGFLAALHGGFWEHLALYTPGAMLDAFEHGLVALNAMLILGALLATGLVIAALWMRLGVSTRRRSFESLLAVLAAGAVITACAFVHPSWDLSENRRHSFPKADEEALARIQAPLAIEAHLAPEDPRRADLEHRALSKLRRLRPSTRIRYVSATSIGLFEQTKSGYGEIWYEIGGKKTMSRLTTSDGVLEAIYGLAGVKPPEDDEPAYPGHPLVAKPAGAAAVFYVAWPALIGGLAFLVLRRHS